MQETEINSLITQLKAEFEAKYPFMTVSLSQQKASRIYGIKAMIRCKNDRTYHSFNFTENITEATLRRHIYGIVNKKGEEYARKNKKISR